MSILGNRVPRTEDPRLLTVGGSYVDDVELPGAAWVAYVRSPIAHARILSIGTQAAEQAPGVIEVLTAAELNEPPRPGSGGNYPPAMARPLLADGTVRFVGEPVAIVMAETRAEAVDATELVEVDYDPLPAVVDVDKALAGETLLFPDAGSNVAIDVRGELDDSIFEGCEVVVGQDIVNQRVAPCPMETRAAAASYGADGRLTHWSATQAPFGVRGAIAKLLGVEDAQVRVVAPDVGGGFGAKMGDYPEELLVAWLAFYRKRAVRWTESRSESMLGLGHGRAQHQRVTIGGSRDGKIEAYRLEVLQDSGAYPHIGAFLPVLTRMMLTGVYDIERAEFVSQSVVTNTTPLVAYRGAGRPEAAAAIERAVDVFAAAIGMDPAEVRRKNFVAADRFPFTTKTGTVYDSGDYGLVLGELLAASGYDELRREQAARRAAHDRVQLGLGLSVYVEITGGFDPGEYSSVEVLEDGSAVVTTGTSSHGQGHATAWAMIVAEALGIPIEKVKFVQSDTDVVPRGIGTFGSRSLQTGGVAARQAAGQVVEMAKELAASVLEVDPADLVVDPSGGLHVAGTPMARLSWSDLSAAASQRSSRLFAEVDFKPAGASFPFGAHLAVVEVDTETGLVRLRRMVAVDDAGRILNPLLADGQIHGGVGQGVAQALVEEFRYDDEGNPLTTNFADYTFISAVELPSFESIRTETPTPNNELGAKGIGEAGTIGATPAVQNAVVDALSHLGVRHVDMPTTPERVWASISSGGTGWAEGPRPPKWPFAAPERTDEEPAEEVVF